MALQRIARALVSALLLFTLIGDPLVRAQKATHETPEKKRSSVLDGFDDYVNRALRDWDVPGVAISIVKDDKLVLAKGYGVKKLGDPSPVDERTIFAIGSASKAFTAAAIAMLVDEGKLKWDDPAAKHLPGFELFDPYATRELTVRDLLCHRSGLERGDLLWYGFRYDREEILRRVRHLKPTWSLRSTFGYQNIMYLAAGEIILRLTGKSWDEFVRDRIFATLGMRSSSTSVTNLEKAYDDGKAREAPLQPSTVNVATPHSRAEGKVEVIPWRNIDNIAPAGSINSNVVDMAEWVRVQLGGGLYKNRKQSPDLPVGDASLQPKRLFSSGAAKEMHMAQTVIRPEPPWSLFYPEARFLTYGLGWFMHDHHGRKVVEHGGNIDGMSALVAMIPEENLGIVILTNLNGNMLPAALKYRIFDAYLGVEKRDWSADLLKTFRAFEEQSRAAQKKVEEARVKDTKPTLARDAYVGTYKNDFYGEMGVALENGNLVLRLGPGFTGDLEHWHYDTFRARWRGAAFSKAYVTFGIGVEGKIEEVKLNLPGLANYPFKRAPEKVHEEVSLSEEALRKFVGRYELRTPPVEVSIEMVGGKLKAVVPGQPVYTLVPISATRFTIDGAPAGFFAQFDMEGDRVKSLTLVQGPGPSLTLLPRQ